MDFTGSHSIVDMSGPFCFLLIFNFSSGFCLLSPRFLTQFFFFQNVLLIIWSTYTHKNLTDNLQCSDYIIYLKQLTKGAYNLKNTLWARIQKLWYHRDQNYKGLQKNKNKNIKINFSQLMMMQIPILPWVCNCRIL